VPRLSDADGADLFKGVEAMFLVFVVTAIHLLIHFYLEGNLNHLPDHIEFVLFNSAPDAIYSMLAKLGHLPGLLLIFISHYLFSICYAICRPSFL
jgi:hypothetical protein